MLLRKIIYKGTKDRKKDTAFAKRREIFNVPRLSKGFAYENKTFSKLVQTKYIIYKFYFIRFQVR